MASINALVQSAPGTTILLAEIKQLLGASQYLVLIDNVERKVYSTLSKSLHVGSKVVINKVSTGKLYIVGETGFTGQSKQQKEVIIDG